MLSHQSLLCSLQVDTYVLFFSLVRWSHGVWINFFFFLIKYSFHMSGSTYAPLNYSSLRSGQKQTVLLSRYHSVHVLKNLNTIKCISPTHPTIGLVVQCNISLNTIDMWKEYLIKIFLFQRFLFNPSPRFPCWCIFSIYCISLPQWLKLNNQNCEAPSLLTISSTLFFLSLQKKKKIILPKQEIRDRDMRAVSASTQINSLLSCNIFPPQELTRQTYWREDVDSHNANRADKVEGWWLAKQSRHSCQDRAAMPAPSIVIFLDIYLRNLLEWKVSSWAKVCRYL